MSDVGLQVPEEPRKKYGEAHERLVVIGAGCSVEAGLPAGGALHAQLCDGFEFYRLIAEQLGESEDVERVFRVIELLSQAEDASSDAHDLMMAIGAWEGRPKDFPASAQQTIPAILKHLRHHLWLSALDKPLATGDDESRVAYLRPLVEGRSDQRSSA